MLNLRDGTVEISARDAYERLHFRGNITHRVPSITTLGIDLIDIKQIAVLGHARRVLGPHVVPAGDLDPLSCLMHGLIEP
jgi:uroporphyrinogen-III decarboxylase